METNDLSVTDFEILAGDPGVIPPEYANNLVTHATEFAEAARSGKVVAYIVARADADGNGSIESGGMSDAFAYLSMRVIRDISDTARRFAEHEE